MHNTPNKYPKFKYNEYFTSIRFMYCKIYTWKIGNVTWYEKAQYVELDFEFDPKPALSATGERWIGVYGPSVHIFNPLQAKRICFI
jgi:hypothetical protein